MLACSSRIEKGDFGEVNSVINTAVLVQLRFCALPSVRLPLYGTESAIKVSPINATALVRGQSKVCFKCGVSSIIFLSFMTAQCQLHCPCTPMSRMAWPVEQFELHTTTLSLLIRRRSQKIITLKSFYFPKNRLIEKYLYNLF